MSTCSTIDTKVEVDRRISRSEPDEHLEQV
jgi:hypothetical protein